MNENKCGQISIGSAPLRPLTLSGNGASIKLLNSTKDLVLAIDNTFKPSIHCAQAFKKARSALFMIRRSFVTLTPDIFILCTPHLYILISSMPSKLRVRTLRRMLITWSAFNVWLPEWLKAVRVCPTRSDLKSWNCFRSYVEDWEVMWSLRTTYSTAPWIYLLRNPSLGHPIPAFEDITWNCIIGVSSLTEGRPPSPFGSLNPGTRCQSML